jgi:O-methyltransferase
MLTPACRRSTSRRRRASCSLSSRAWRGRRRRWRSARSAAIRRSALPALCRGRAGLFRSNTDKHANVARANIARAGLSDRVEVRAGAALDILPKIEAEGLGPFDFVFIDADKSNNAHYLIWALRLSRPGTAIVVEQCRERRPDRRCGERGSGCDRHAPHVRDDGARAALAGDGHPDCRRQGLGRLRAGDRRVSQTLAPHRASKDARLSTGYAGRRGAGGVLPRPEAREESLSLSRPRSASRAFSAPVHSPACRSRRSRPRRRPTRRSDGGIPRACARWRYAPR